MGIILSETDRNRYLNGELVKEYPNGIQVRRYGKRQLMMVTPEGDPLNICVGTDDGFFWKHWGNMDNWVKQTLESRLRAAKERVEKAEANLQDAREEVTVLEKYQL